MSSHSVLYSASNAKEVLEICLKAFELLSNAQRNIYMLIDIDGTLIQPLSVATQYPSSFIDRLKDINPQHPAVGAWRSQRQVHLTDKQWPHILQKLETYGPTWALTAIRPGCMPPLNSIEKWRVQELSKLGLHFSGQKPEGFQFLDPQYLSEIAYHEGVIFSGNVPKHDAFDLLFKKHHKVSNADSFQSAPLHCTNDAPHGQGDIIIFVEDNLSNLQRFKQYCVQHHHIFIGIHTVYERAAINQRIASFQEKQLLDTGVWHEDEQAQELLT